MATVFGCPYEHHVPLEQIIRTSETLFDMGINELSLGDTIGAANPVQVQRVLEVLLKRFPKENLQDGKRFPDRFVNIFPVVCLACRHENRSFIDPSFESPFQPFSVRNKGCVGVDRRNASSLAGSHRDSKTSRPHH